MSALFWDAIDDPANVLKPIFLTAISHFSRLIQQNLVPSSESFFNTFSSYLLTNCSSYVAPLFRLCVEADSRSSNRAEICKKRKKTERVSQRRVFLKKQEAAVSG